MANNIFSVWISLHRGKRTIIFHINTSATAIAMLDHIEAQDVTCMTNMGKAILLESVRPNVSLMLTGGEIRPPRTSLTGVPGNQGPGEW